MADNTTGGDYALPTPPTTGAAPGTQGYQNGSGSHMPPPPVPSLNVNIPKNHNPVPTELTDILSPTSAGGQVRRAAPEPNKRALYVGGLDPRVTEDVLKQIFETTGHVQSVKIIPDKNFQSKGYNYGFVEYDDPGAAERAMQTLNGRRVHQQEIRVNWAYQSNTSAKEDTSNHFHIFVGDLSNEVNDEVLLQAFSAFGNVSEARVMWDMKTGRSRGYGFAAFRDRGEAEKALSSMDGEWLGSRAIRCNWANQKGQPSFSQQQAMAQMGLTPTTPYGHHQFPTQGTQSYEMIVAQTPQWQTTVYVGNLTPYTTQNDLVPLFQNFGYVTETRFQSDRGFAFIKMDTHENAANAICQLSGYQVNGRPLKCSWGKDRPPTGQFDGFSPASATPGSAFPSASPQPFFPQYGQPGAMSPQAATPAGFQQPSPAGWQQPGMTPSGMHPGAPGWPGAQMPPSAGGFNPQHSASYSMHQASPQAPFGRGYGGYQEYIRLLRQHIARGRRENALSSVYSHLDRSAYWRSEADRAKAGLKAAEDEVVDLRRQVASLNHKLETRPSSPVKKRKKLDEDVILVPRSPKRAKRAGPLERTAPELLDLFTDVEFSQAGEIGDALLRGVFKIIAALKPTQKVVPTELVCHIVQASSAISKAVQREVEEIVAEQVSDHEQLKIALTITIRAFAKVLAGFVRLGHTNDASAGPSVQGQAIYAIVVMFRNLLSYFQLLSAREAKMKGLNEAMVANVRPSTARPSSPVKPNSAAARPLTARPSTPSTTATSRMKFTAKGRAPQTKDPAIQDPISLSLYACFLGKLVDMIDPKVEANRALFEGFAYCVLDHLGKRLYRVVFEHDRAIDIEAEIRQDVGTRDQNEATPPQPDDNEKKQITLEAPHLLHLLNRIMAAAPAHLGNINGIRNSKTKYSSKTLAKNTLAVSAKECLQRTLVNGMFGQPDGEADDPFKECFGMPVASEAPSLASRKNKDVDVLEHFKEEIWRCLGWEILAKEGDWGF